MLKRVKKEKKLFTKEIRKWFLIKPIATDLSRIDYYADKDYLWLYLGVFIVGDTQMGHV